MSSKTWVGSFQGCHINRKYSHFTREVGIFIVENPKQNSKEFLVRDQGFNKKRSYSYNPRDYKRPPLIIQIPIFGFHSFSLLINLTIFFPSRIKLLYHQSNFKTLISLLRFENFGLFILGLPYKQKMILIFEGGWNFHY